jgi:hypothetical protein
VKLYAVRVEMTRWADVHVVAESEDAAIDLALDRARDILDDCDAEDEAEASADEARGGWTPGELPYLTDEAAEVEVELCRIPRGGDATCDQWAEALKGAAPVVDDTTLPLALPYDDGRTERVTAVPQIRAAGGVQ